MENIENYIKLSYEARTLHLDLNLDCIEIGGNSTSFKGLLSYFLNTTIPSGSKIQLCHKCNNCKCSNPRHLYYGTAKENVHDQIEAGTFFNAWQRRVNKYGYDEACRMNGMGNKSSGGKANFGKPKSEEHKRNIAESLKKRKEE